MIRRLSIIVSKRRAIEERYDQWTTSDKGNSAKSAILAALSRLAGFFCLTPYVRSATIGVGVAASASVLFFAESAVAFLASRFYKRKWILKNKLQSGSRQACGYDLRASTRRCPECGTPIPVGAKA